MTSNTSEWLYDVWGTSSSDVFAVGDMGTIIHFNGSSWSKMPTGTAETLWGVWASSSSNVYAAGDADHILHYGGGGWSIIYTSQEWPSTVWGIGPNQVFVVGTNGGIERFDGTSWNKQSTNTSVTLRGVWGSAANDIHVVGQSGTILHWNGISWSPSKSNTVEYLKKAWGTGPTDIYVVGERGTIAHYNGTNWLVATATSSHLNDVWGTPNNIYVVGDSGTLLRFDGAVWKSVPLGTSVDLRGIYGFGSADIFIVGEGGGVWRSQP